MFDSGPNRGSQSSFSELIEVIGNLASEVENAKELSRRQIDLLESQLTEAQARAYSLMEERDEAFRSLSAVKLEKDQLLLQLSDLRKKVDQQRENDEARLALLQLRQVQEELENYFVLSRQQTELLEANTQLLDANEDLYARFTALLANANLIG